MKHLFTKQWRHIAILSGLFACLLTGSYLAFPGGNTTQHPEIKLQAASPRTIKPKVEGATNNTPAATTPTTGNTQTPSSTSSGISTTKSLSTSSSSTSPSTSSPTQPATQSQPSSVMVTLDVDSKLAGDVKVAASANQCDVLTDALVQEIISSLDMRYFSNLASYGVFVINGQGNSDEVWWTYSVNGKSPPVGCSEMGVSDGETINWQYTGK